MCVSLKKKTYKCIVQKTSQIISFNILLTNSILLFISWFKLRFLDIWIEKDNIFPNFLVKLLTFTAVYFKGLNDFEYDSLTVNKNRILDKFNCLINTAETNFLFFFNSVCYVDFRHLYNNLCAVIIEELLVRLMKVKRHKFYFRCVRKIWKDRASTLRADVLSAKTTHAKLFNIL